MKPPKKGSAAVYVMIGLGIVCMVVVAAAAYMIIEWDEAGAGAKAARMHQR